VGRRRSLLVGVLVLSLAVIVLVSALSGNQFGSFEGGKEAVPASPAPPLPSTPSLPATSPSQSASVSPTVRRVPASPMIGLEIPALDRSYVVEGVSLGTPIEPPFNPATVGHTLYYENNHAVRGADPGTDSDNVVYVTGHTWRSGDAAMNLIDRKLAVGDELRVTTVNSKRLGVQLCYVVEDTEYPPEEELPFVEKMWEVAPGRLNLFTCKLREDGGEQSHTRVFFAELRGTC